MLVTSPHDNIVDNYPEINDWLGTGPNGAKTGTEGETEEDDPERVGAGPVCEGPPVLSRGGVPHLPRPGLHTTQSARHTIVIINSQSRKLLETSCQG